MSSKEQMEFDALSQDVARLVLRLDGPKNLVNKKIDSPLSMTA